MNRAIAIILVQLFSMSIFSQTIDIHRSIIADNIILTNDSITTNNSSDFYALTTPPEFPGGDDAFICFFEHTINLQILNRGDQQGWLYARFVVDRIGTIADIDFNKNIRSTTKNLITDSLVQNEVMRVLRLSPKWEPGKENNINMPCYYVLPIKIPYKDFRCFDQKTKKHCH